MTTNLKIKNFFYISRLLSGLYLHLIGDGIYYLSEDDKNILVILLPSYIILINL